MDFERRKRPFRHLGTIIDGINILLALVQIVCIVLIIIDAASNMLLFPVVFFCTSLMNMALAVKYFKRRETGKVILFLIGLILFMAMGIASMVIVL
ncbi:MAG: hypothetical protein IJV71_10440 [Lachnospiraceae bacterium]|nr:hypothetical protein [Lachnospiraceae bacterium]